MYKLKMHHLEALVLILLGISVHYAKGAEYCATETMELSCPGGAIDLLNACYGVKNLGRCVQRDFGYVGCYDCVRSYMDYICSGRPSCQFTVPDNTLETVFATSCPGEITRYLDINHVCHEVITREETECEDGFATQEIGADTGYISSYKEARNPLYNKQSCHWRLRFPKGSRITFEILDFGTASAKLNLTDPVCHCVFEIKDLTVEPHIIQSVTCGEQKRTRYVMTTGNEVEITRILKHTTHKTPEFLIKYQVMTMSGTGQFVPYIYLSLFSLIVAFVKIF